MKEYDLVVLGAGPGGYTAALRAAQLGMKVAVVEQERPGGVCLNWGCIPSKSILTSAELYDEVSKRGEGYGLRVEGLSVDYAAVVERSRQVADRLAKGVAGLLKRAGVESIAGRGALAAPDSVEVAGEGAPRRVRGRNVLIAVGSVERSLPGLPVDGDVVLTSRHVLESRRLPASVVIVGAGPVGVEFAYAYRCFGAQVTIVEMESQLLPGADREVAEELRRQFRRRGITVLTGTRFEAVRRGAEGAEIEARSEGADKTLAAQQVLVAVGRKPQTEAIGLQRIGVAAPGGFIKVGGDMRTSVPGVYAVGDVTGPPLLAHRAAAQGVAAVENMAGVEARRVDDARIPACVYCQPEVAAVGWTEEQARAHGREVRTAKVPFLAIGKAVASGHTEGFVKLVVDESCGGIAGCHIIGKGATDLIAEAALAMALESTTKELGETVHAHPTLSEAIMEAALGAEGRALNY